MIEINGICITYIDGSHRVPYFPSMDISGAPQEVQDAAVSLWTDQAIADWRASFPVSEPVPDWTGFLNEFTDPTSANYETIYAATATAAQASPPNVLEHWTNLKVGLMTRILDETKFQNSAEYLNQMLIAAGNPLSQATKDAWVALAASYNISLVLS